MYVSSCLQCLLCRLLYHAEHAGGKGGRKALPRGKAAVGQLGSNKAAAVAAGQYQGGAGAKPPRKKPSAPATGKRGRRNVEIEYEEEREDARQRH